MKNNLEAGIAIGMMLGGKKANIDEFTATAPGVYHAADHDLDAFDPFTVDITLGQKSVTENGVYQASDDNYAGYDIFTVNVPSGNIEEKTINTNGTYTAEAPVDGFSPVHVRVPSWAEAKEFYENGGIGQAGVGGRGYIDQLANDILGNGEHVENTNTETGWRITFEPATSGRHPENGMSIHLKNDTLSPTKDYVLKNITSTSSGSMIYRPTHYTIEPYTLGGSQTYIVSYNYRVSYNSGTTWLTGTSSTDVSYNFTDAYVGYLSGGEYVCTVVA